MSEDENILKLTSVDYVGDLLEGKQNKLTAGENITITEDNVINASGGGSGELKAKTWLCTFLDKYAEAGCGFSWLYEIEQPAVENHRIYPVEDIDYCAAIIKFKEAKSMAEVNNWLMHDFKSYNGNTIISYGSFPLFRAIAVCVMPDNSDEWPEAN